MDQTNQLFSSKQGFEVEVICVGKLILIKTPVSKIICSWISRDLHYPIFVDYPFEKVSTAHMFTHIFHIVYVFIERLQI